MPKTNLLASAFDKSNKKKDEQQKQVTKAQAPQNTDAPPSRQGKKGIVAYVDPLVIRELKILSADKSRSMQDLFIEAINDLLLKHGKKPIA